MSASAMNSKRLLEVLFGVFYFVKQNSCITSMHYGMSNGGDMRKVNLSFTLIKMVENQYGESYLQRQFI